MFIVAPVSATCPAMPLPKGTQMTGLPGWVRALRSAQRGPHIGAGRGGQWGRVAGARARLSCLCCSSMRKSVASSQPSSSMLIRRRPSYLRSAARLAAAGAQQAG